MKAIEILDHFLSKANWVDKENTVDRIIVGDPQKEIKTVLVTWISSFEAIRTAVKKQVDMLITHEPTFWKHRGELEDNPHNDFLEVKKRYIEDNNLVILRNHDVWDRFPDIGIPWAWAKFLGLGTQPVKIGNCNYQHRYDIEPVTLEEFAKRMAKKTSLIGEPFVQVTGEGSAKISKIGIGTGCCCKIEVYQEMGCDLSIVCDDGSCYWAGIQCAADNNHPVIRVNHGTSEEPGMMSLTEYINENLPIQAEHLSHGSTFRLIA